MLTRVLSALSGCLAPWCQLLSITDEFKRKFQEEECRTLWYALWGWITLQACAGHLQIIEALSLHAGVEWSVSWQCGPARPARGEWNAAQGETFVSGWLRGNSEVVTEAQWRVQRNAQQVEQNTQRRQSGRRAHSPTWRKFRTIHSGERKQLIFQSGEKKSTAGHPEGHSEVGWRRCKIVRFFALRVSELR